MRQKSRIVTKILLANVTQDHETCRYWCLKIELGTIATITLVGERIKNMRRDSGINTTTIVHFYGLHSYVLPVAAIALSVAHLAALVTQEQQQKNLL